MYIYTCKNVTEFICINATVDLDSTCTYLEISMNLTVFIIKHSHVYQHPREIFEVNLMLYIHSIVSAAHQSPNICFPGAAGTDCAAGTACLSSSGAVRGRKRHCLYQWSNVSLCMGVVFILPLPRLEKSKVLSDTFYLSQSDV